MISLPFQEWFTSNNIVGGDWKFFWEDNLREALSYTLAWDSSLNTGIGKDNLSFLWLNSYVAYLSHFLTQVLQIPWNIAEKLMFFWPIVFISFFSAFFLSKVFLKDKFLNVLSGIIYLTNTYALMIFSGGQVGVALAYSLAPLVLVCFCKITNLRLSAIAGLILASQILFDPRIAILSMIMVLVYFLFHFKTLIKNVLLILVVPLIIAVFLHMFWILPIAIFRISPITSTLDQSQLSSQLVRFFSFAYFENTLSLLHPNWPENIFGKTGFMKPEFLLMPIFAFSALLFSKEKKVLFLVSLGIAGAFLAKGTNPPFGEIYMWFTNNINLFAMYRDPTKWYLFTAVAYSILIPLSLQYISKRVAKKLKLQNITLIVFIIYFIFLLRPLFLSQVKGTFTPRIIPSEYIRLKEFIGSKPEFFRTLWIPKLQRFGYSTNDHPAISWSELFESSSLTKNPLDLLTDKKKILQEIGVKYVIVPYDSEGEIFLEDRKHDEKQYLTLVRALENTDFLKEINVFNKIKVFGLEESMDRFWIKNPRNNFSLSYRRINSANYSIKVENAKAGDVLVFAEGFSPNWVATLGAKKLASKPFKNKINSFYLPSDGTYSLKINYSPEYWENAGSYISLSSLIIIFFFLFAADYKTLRNLS